MDKPIRLRTTKSKICAYFSNFDCTSLICFLGGALTNNDKQLANSDKQLMIELYLIYISFYNSCLRPQPLKYSTKYRVVK